MLINILPLIQFSNCMMNKAVIDDLISQIGHTMTSTVTASFLFPLFFMPFSSAYGCFLNNNWLYFGSWNRNRWKRLLQMRNTRIFFIQLVPFRVKEHISYSILNTNILKWAGNLEIHLSRWLFIIWLLSMSIIINIHMYKLFV